MKFITFTSLLFLISCIDSYETSIYYNDTFYSFRVVTEPRFINNKFNYSGRIRMSESDYCDFSFKDLVLINEKGNIAETQLDSSKIKIPDKNKMRSNSTAYVFIYI